MDAEGDHRLRELERAALVESPAVVRWIKAIRRYEAFPESLEGLMELHRQIAAEISGTEDILDRVLPQSDRTRRMLEGKEEPPSCDWFTCAARPVWCYMPDYWAVFSCAAHESRIESAMRNAASRRQRTSFGWSKSPVPPARPVPVSG